MAERFTHILQCTECKNRNYHFSRGKRKDYKVEVKKFCRACGKHTVHKETKSS
jgi:large subunit ribosomal protein L33